jgi:hypothetical protein
MVGFSFVFNQECRYSLACLVVDVVEVAAGRWRSQRGDFEYEDNNIKEVVEYLRHPFLLPPRKTYTI